MLISFIRQLFKKKKKTNKEENNSDLCHYSGLPSVSSYTVGEESPNESNIPDFIDYDGMGNQGRFPEVKK